MIIGFAGKKQHGKDTSAEIWDYFNSEHIAKISFKGYIDYKNYMSGGMNIVVLKFADKLKQITALLTGCMVPQLENTDFKESFLPEAWGTNSTFIGTRGQASAKFEGDLDNVQISKYIKNDIYEWTHTGRMTYRDALQKIGTDALRNNFHQNVWVFATMTEVMKYSDCLITDVRFPNEVKAIEDSGGIVIKVYRSDMESSDEHPSETALDNHKFKYIASAPTGIESLFNELLIIYKSYTDEKVSHL